MTVVDRLAREAPTGITLRQETDGDLAFIEALFASTRADEMARVPWPPEAIAAFLQSQCALQRAHYRQHYGDALFLIVEQDHRPVGRLYLHESASELRIMDIALLPDTRGRGVGTTLVRSVIGHARDATMRVTLHVEPDNPAQRLYARQGFRLVEHRGVYDFLEWRPSRPLEQLTAGDFEAVTRDTFTLRRDSGETIALTLDAITRRPAAGANAREGFSLVFESASGTVLPQRIYRLEQDRLGPLQVFLVPIGRGPNGIRYEAVFG